MSTQDLSYTAGALAEGVTFRGISLATEEEDTAFRGVTLSVDGGESVFRGLVFSAEPPTEAYYYGSGVGKGTVSSPYSASAIGSSGSEKTYDAAALAILLGELGYDASAQAIISGELSYTASAQIALLVELGYYASAHAVIVSELGYEVSASLLQAPELEYQASGNLLGSYQVEYQASGVGAYAMTDLAYQAGALAFQQSFRGITFSSEEEQTSFRGLSFSSEEEQTSFRGLSFSSESAENSSFRGLVFGYEPPTEQFYQASASALAALTVNYMAAAVAVLAGDQVYDASAIAQGHVAQLYMASAFANTSADADYTASAVAQTTLYQTYNVSALGQVTQSADYQSSSNIQATVDSSYYSSVDVFAAVEDMYSASTVVQSIVEHTYSSSTIAQETLSIDYSSSVLGQATEDTNYSASVIAQALIDSAYNASVIAQKAVTVQNFASAVAARRHSMLLVHERTFSGTAVFSPVQGSSSGYTANNPNTLFAWIADDAGTDRLYGRLDNSEMEEGAPGHVPEMEISTETGMEGVKVAHFRSSNRWAVVWKRGGDIKYRIFDSTLTPVTGDVTVTNTAPALVTPDHFDIGCTDAERLIVVYDGNIKIIDVDSPATVTQIPMNTSAVSANKITVHRVSTAFDILYIDGPDLKVDRYDSLGNYVVTVVAATGQTGTDPLHMDIVGCQNGNSFLVTWIADDELRYRLFDSTALPQTPVLTFPGSAGLSAGGRSLFAAVGNQEDFFSFMVKVTSDDHSFLAWIRTEAFLSSVLEEQLIGLSDAQSTPTPITGVNEFQFRHIYEAGGSVVHETYVNSSVYMGLWRIERDNRSFVDTTTDANPYLNRDGDAASLIDGVFSGYVGGNRLSGSAGTDGSDYTSAPGRGSVDVDNDNFDDFLGSVDEDTFLIGGPVHSEVANAMQMNSNMFASQISYLSEELGITALSFVDVDQALDGLQYGTNAPGLSVTNGNGTFELRRHLSLGGDAVDYAVILRLAMEPDSTQEDLPQNKSFWYVAGVTSFSTEAAANAVAFPVEFRLGQSSALLVIVTYPDGTTSYVPGVTPGTIVTVPLKDVDADDFEG